MNPEQIATDIVKRLTRIGHVAYFAGGCVRDRLLGIVPKDFDVVTSARPEQVREVFGRSRTIAIGQSFGVITVLGPGSVRTEVATFRSDGTYSDGRHPDHVSYSTPQDDAARRDFTINGMFYDPGTDQVIDYVGGLQDLRAGLIRAIGDPDQRFEEDRLRMLRAVRFAATYGFQIDVSTLRAIQSQHATTTSVSQERITQELQTMLSHANRRRALELLVESRLLRVVLPCVDDVVGQPDRWQRLLNIVSALKESSLAVVLALLLGSESAALDRTAARAECRRLKVSNDVRKTVEWIIAHQAQLKNAPTSTFAQLQPLLLDANIESALDLLDATDTVDQSSRQAIEYCRGLLQLPSEELDPEPLVRGEDLQRLGLHPGPRFKQLLNLVRSAQLNGELASRSAALDYLRRAALKSD